MHKIIFQIRQKLNKMSDPSLAASGKRFFKEEIKMYGTKTADVGKLAKKSLLKLKDLPKSEIFELCEELWKSGYMEETFIGCKWAYSIHKLYTPEDFKIFDKWVKNYVSNWAACDTLCNHTVGTFVEMYPEFIRELKKWAKSENRWVKRAAAVTLIIPARKGMFLRDIFEIANILLLDKDDLVQKGYGWMLKAASQANQQEVFEYVMSNKEKTPRTALRYAIEKMPEALRKQAMRK